MTYLQIVNQVLRRLREDTVSQVTQSDYSTLIGDLVNDVKREVEDSWNWHQLRNTIQVDTEDGTFKYTLTGAGKRYKLLNAFNDTQDYTMRIPPQDYMTRLFLIDQQQRGSPLYFDINGQSNGDPQVDLWPIPDGVYNLHFDMVIPQDDLSDDTDELTIPHWPVVLGTWAYAISERGEEGGMTAQMAFDRYSLALSDAIIQDSQNHPDEVVWSVF